MSEIKKIKPALSKGTRDFLPVEVAKRNYIFETIKSVFRKYGFEEIETPAIERMETLTGKYGDEGDKLLFKILNSGDFLKDVPKDELAAANSSSTLKYIAEKGLRYDLTVPLARYVVQHQENLAFPFKRFHIGPVWRADRPQKGRYQEFYQCDADVIGSTSLLNEVELTMIYAEIFQKLNFTVSIRINSRKILEALAVFLIFDSSNEILNKDEFAVKLSDFVTIMDKLDKIGESGVRQEFISRGYSLEKIDFFETFLKKINSIGNAIQRLNEFKDNQILMTAANSANWKEGIADLEKIFTLTSNIRNLEFDPTLARGLNYYTGIIWEIKLAASLEYGSLGGGGRYDNLTEMFGAKNMSGVGISFGIERIYDVMEELNLFPKAISQGVKVLFVPREEDMEEFAFQQVQALRNDNIAAELYLGNVKKKNHFKYIEDKHIAYFVEVGGDEKTTGKFRLRNVQTRDTQSDLTLNQLIQMLQ